MLAISICEIYSSVVLYNASNGFFIGAMYSGVSCALVALFGLSTLIKWRYSMGFFVAFILLDAISFIIAIIGTALTSQTLMTLNAVSSCAYYKPRATSCLSGVTNLACVGMSSSFLDASDCASGTFSSSGSRFYYQNDVAAPSDACYCVFQSSLSQCATFSGIPYCPDMLYHYPDLIKMTFNFAWPLILLSAMLLCFRNPEALDIIDQRSHRPIQLPVGEVMILAEGSERPRDVIVTTAEWKPHFQLSTLSNANYPGNNVQEVQQASAVTLRQNVELGEEKKVDDVDYAPSIVGGSSSSRSSQQQSSTVNNYTNINTTDDNRGFLQRFFLTSTSLAAPRRTSPTTTAQQGGESQPDSMIVTDAVVIVDEDVIDDLEQQRVAHEIELADTRRR